MPWLLAALTTLFGNLAAKFITFLGERMARRLVVGATIITVMLAAFAAFFATITGLLAGLSASISSQTILTGMWLALPPNATSCMSAMASAYLARMAWQWIQFKAKVLMYESWV